MSVVSGIMIFASVIDGDKLDAINAWVSARMGWPPSTVFIDVADHTGGTKHPQFCAWGAGINYGFELAEALPAFLAEIDWDDPENVVLVVQPETGPTTVWRPEGYRGE